LTLLHSPHQPSGESVGMAAVAAPSSPPAVITCQGTNPSHLNSREAVILHLAAIKFDGLRAAAVAWGPGLPLVMEQVEVAPPGPMEIRVKVVSTSVCRSDVSAWQSKVRTAASCIAFAQCQLSCASLSSPSLRMAISTCAYLYSVPIPTPRRNLTCSPESSGTKHPGACPDQ
jgi:hypothetical protein